MDMFERFNTKFGKWYEGLFSGAGGELRPKDVLRKITQAMEDSRKEGFDGKVYVPNKYVLELAVDDPEERDYLLSFLDEDELVSVLQRFMTQNHYHARGPLDFTIADAPDAPAGGRREKLRVKVRFEKGEMPQAIAEPEPVRPPASPLAPGQINARGMNTSGAGRLTPPDTDDQPTIAGVSFNDDEPGTVPAVAWASLAVTAPDGRKSHFSLTKPAVHIGRGRNAGNDLILDSDGKVSKTHARLEREPDGHWTLYDLGSTNGIAIGASRVNGNRVLRDGDIITIGATTLSFHENSADDDAPGNADETAPLRRARLVTPDGTAHILASETLLGRAVTSDIVLPDPSVSSRHARIIAPDAATYSLEDLGSTHGTWLNGSLIPPHQRVRLTPGDTLRLGETDLHFQGSLA